MTGQNSFNTSIPRISVLMSVYNGELYLRQAIDSILGQTFPDFEFLIINDGSTDATREIILSYRDPRIRLIENEVNIGLTKSLNKGLSLARGEFIARQDADDISHPTRFEKQVEFLNTYHEVAVLGTQARYINAFGQLFRTLGWERASNDICIRWLCMFESPFIHSSVMMRSKVVKDECGGYNGDYLTNQDHELWTRIVYRHVCRNLVEPLIDFRTHSKSLSSNYTIDRMKHVAFTLRQAACEGLGQEPPAGWIDLWIRVNNSDLYNGKFDVGSIVRMIDVMYNRFVAFNLVTKENEDILHHKNRMLLRIAYNSANFDRFASIALFWKICRHDIKIVVPLIPKYMLALMFGQRAAQLYRAIKSFRHGLHYKYHV